MYKTITRLTSYLLFIMCLGCSFSVTAQNDGSKIPLADALKTIQLRFKTQFAYEHGLLDAKFTTQKDLQGKSVEDVLKNVLYPNNLIFLYVSENSYSIVARSSSFFTGMLSNNLPETPARPQPFTGTRVLRGTITNERGEAVPFVNVWVKGTNQGTQTNDNGGYLLSAVSTGSVISFSAVGYTPQEIILNDQFKIDVLLKSNNMLNEVTVVNNGYQQISKERATGSATIITAKQIEEHPQDDNLLDRLESLAPGLKINLTSGDRGFYYQSGSSIATTNQSLSSGVRTVGKNDYDMSIRGVSTLQAEQSPLIVVDGAITELNLSTINPSDVESISVLKDAAAASIWGVRAANGVIVITSKKGKKGQTPNINFSTNFNFAEKPNLGYYKMMNSAQQLSYEKELVVRNFLPAIAPSSYFNALYVMSPGTYLAQQLQAGTITQAQYDTQAAAMGAIDNTSQVSKYLLQSAQSQQYNFSVGGGNDYSTYYYSTSYSHERPNEVLNTGNRLTLTLNNTWTLFKVATLSTSFKGSFFNLVNDGLNLNTLYSPGRTTLLPYEQLADANGNGISYDRLTPSYTSALSGAYKSWKYNYLDELANNDNTQKDNNYVFNIGLKAPIYKGLSASALYTNERTFTTNRTYYNQNTFYARNVINYYTYPTASTNSLGITDGGFLQELNTNQNNYSLRGQLDFDRTLGKHQITAIAGTEIRETNIGQNIFSLAGYNTQTGLTNSSINYSNTPTYSYIAGSSAASYTSYNYGGYPSQADKERRFLSYYANAAYTYNLKYVLSGSVRYDDYNNFGLDRQYRATPLWSAGAKWNIKEESFLKPVSWVDNLSIRATYGVNGNLSLTNYPFTWITINNSLDPVSGQNYATILSPANPELRWEKTYVNNIGLDFSLFGSRLNGSIDAYYKNSKDLLYSFPIGSAYVGITTTALTRNGASLTGKGFELNLNGNLYQHKDWEWNAAINFSYNTNTVTDGRFDPLLYQSYFGYYPAGISYLTGYTTDKLLVYRNAGLDANGLTQIYDHNGNIVSATTTTLGSVEDLKYAGRTTAPYYGGFNTTIRYKRFSLFAQTSYQFGNVFLKPTIQSYITSPYTTNYDLSADIANRWMKSGDEAKTNVPGLNGTANAVFYSLSRYQNSDINVLKGDYIRLRQLTFNYLLPTLWLSKMGIKTSQLGVSANNLGLLWTANKQGYDPDFANYVGSVRGLPAARSYSINLNVNF